MNSLSEVFYSHKNKTSDRWHSYINKYEKLFAPFRNEPINLLEIGIQNGGSLEIWSQYFTKAQQVIGCDINKACAELIYHDQRVQIVIGDASQPETRHQIISLCPNFDIVIDDGSHKSGDIIKAFANYFPCLNAGGLFIVEDLHCSYWDEYEGGLYYPFSSISFFKYLADVVNFEHWGVSKTASQYLVEIQEKYNVFLDENTLNSVFSIEFINSMCIIQKKSPEHDVKLGPRVVTGCEALIDNAPYTFQGQNPQAQIQSQNLWSSNKASLLIEEALKVFNHQKNINQNIIEQNNQIDLLKNTVIHNSEQKEKMIQAITSSLRAQHISIEQLVNSLDSFNKKQRKIEINFRRRIKQLKKKMTLFLNISLIALTIIALEVLIGYFMH